MMGLEAITPFLPFGFSGLALFCLVRVIITFIKSGYGFKIEVGPRRD
jgi:hypothetical protein